MSTRLLTGIAVLGLTGLLVIGALIGGTAPTPAPRSTEASDTTDTLYTQRPPSRNGIGKVYMRREISAVMGHRGADWLVRPRRGRGHATRAFRPARLERHRRGHARGDRGPTRVDLAHHRPGTGRRDHGLLEREESDMSDPDPMSDAKVWVRHAREDLQAGRWLLEEESGVPRQSAWFAQQAAEKALKALLISDQRSFPYP